MKWQSNWQEIPALSNPPTELAGGYFLNDDEFAIKIVQVVYANHGGQMLYAVYMGTDGCWHKALEGTDIPVYKVFDAKRLIKAHVIQPLQEGVHVMAKNMDACERCGYTGQMAHSDNHNFGEELPCPGWTNLKLDPQ